MLKSFEKIYETKYGHGTATSDVTMYAITYRVHGFGKMNMPELIKHELGDADASAAVKDVRQVYFSDAGGFVDTNIYDGDLLQPGHCFSGPAIVESVDTTGIIHPGQEVEVDAYSNILINN